MAKSGDIGNSQQTWLKTTINGPCWLSFYWKVSSGSGDRLKLYIDGSYKTAISGSVDWEKKTYQIGGLGVHTVEWRYVKDSSGSDGDDCGWVDFVQWTGASPVPDSDNWQQLDYKYDVVGRRSEKKIDGCGTRYLYDGDHVIAEYDGNNNLLRKFIYGPGIDQPVSMIEVADSSATYYYHYDALGSVIALSDSSGDTVQTYEYSVFGEVAVEDANHTNPYMFAGRRYDIEIGLYYNRARYYNPYTGRFLQADPIGYGDGMNMYAYCRNNSVNYRDPSGLSAGPNSPNSPNNPSSPNSLIESVGDIVSDVVEGAGNMVCGVIQLIDNAVQQIMDDIASHQEVAFYVIGPNGTRLPVKVFESRSEKSGIPGLAGWSMNIGGELHIGPEMEASLIASQFARDAHCVDLESLGTPITYSGSCNWHWGVPTGHERTMAHEIGHQVDADNFPGLYQTVGLILTLDRESKITKFEENADNRGEYYGIDWNYFP